MNHRRDAAFVRHAAFDAFRHQFVAALGPAFELELVLEIAVAASAPHGADRSHAAVFLETAALVKDELARTLVATGEKVADQHGACAYGNGLRDVAREPDPAVRKYGHVV